MKKCDGKIRINAQVGGEPAKVLVELKRRGLVTSNPDAVVQGLLALHEKVLKIDLMKTKVAEKSAE